MLNEHPQHGLRTVWWEESAHAVVVCMIDQTALPQELITLRLADEQQVAEAIKTLRVRGAPAIGISAAFGFALALYRYRKARDEDADRTITHRKRRRCRNIYTPSVAYWPARARLPSTYSGPSSACSNVPAARCATAARFPNWRSACATRHRLLPTKTLRLAGRWASTARA